MADRKLQYIIEMIADDTQLRKQMKGWDWADIMGTAGKSFGDMMADEANYGANEIKKAFKGLNVDWTQILGTKEIGQLEQALARSLQKNKIAIQNMANEKDAQGIQNTIDMIVELGKEFQTIGSNFDAGQIARSLGSFMKAISTDKIAKFVADTEALAGVFDKFFNGKMVSSATQIGTIINQTATGVSEGAKKIQTAISRIEVAAKDTGGLEAQRKQLESFVQMVADFQMPKFKDMSLEQLETEIDRLDEAWDKLESKFSKDISANYKSGKPLPMEYKREAALIQAQQIALYDEWNLKAPSVGYDNKSIEDSIEATDELRTAVNETLKETEQSLKKLQNEINASLKDSLAKVISEQLSEIQLKLTLPSEEAFVADINNYIAEINKKPLDGIKIDIGQSANIIEDKTTRAYGQNPGDDDANTTALVNKTKKRFKAVRGAMYEGQNKILKATEKWRKNMLDQLKFKNGDFEFNFGDSLFESLQSYLNEQGNELKFVVDQDTIKEQLKMVIENSGLTLGGFGGTATIDPNAIAQAVYQGMQAAVNGQPIPSFDATSNSDSPKKEMESAADIINSTDKYVKTITEKTINVDRVINVLRDFASASTKKGVGRQNVARWLTSRGIDIDAINAGVSEETIISMLNEALMAKDKFGYARGSTFADTLNKLKDFGITGGKQESDVNTLRSEIVEMLNRMGINQEYWQESQRRYQSYESYENAAKYGRPIATLSKARKPLYANSMKNFVDGGYKRLTDDKYIGDLDTSVEYIDALQNEHLAKANQEIELTQQKAIKLKEEFTELDKKSIEAKERLDKAEEEYNRLKGIPEEQRTKKDNADIIKAKKEFDEAKNQYAWNKRDSEAKKKEYLRLVTYKDKDGNSHVGLIGQMKERRDAQQSVYDDAKSQIKSFKDSILGLGENPAEEAIKALEQVAKNFFEQSGKMLQNLFKHYGDKDTFQGRVTLQNGRTIDISSPYDFLGFKDDEVADVDVYSDILMKRWEKSKSVKKGIPQDRERPNYYVNRPKAPMDIENERVETQDFSPIDAPKTPDLTNSIRTIESNIQQLSEEKKKTSDELAELDKVIESKEQEAIRISELVNALTETERADLTKNAEKAQKQIIAKQSKQATEQQEVDRINSEIFKTESDINALAQSDVNSEFEEKQNNLINRINNAKLEREKLSKSYVIVYDAYNEAVTKHEEAKKAYEDYIDKLVNEALAEKVKSGDIKKIAKEQGISELEAINISKGNLYREFNYSGREDIKALRDQEVETRFNMRKKEEAYKQAKGSIENLDSFISQREQERDNLTVEALQTEKDAALERKKNALADLQHQKKLAEKRLARAQQAEQGASDVLSNNVVLQQKEAERKLNELRSRRTKLSEKIENSDSSIASNQQRKEKLELQAQYNQLKEKELILQREIDQLEDGEVKDTKQSEINEARTKLIELESKITALGGSVNSIPQREYTESEKKSDALMQAADIQNRLMIAKAQKRAYDNDVKEIEKLEQNVRTGGLTSNLGVKEFNKFKFAATVDFKKSDYYQNARNQEKDNLEKELDKFVTEQSKAITEKIEEKKNAIRDQVIEKVIGKKQIDFKSIRKNAIDEYVKTDAYQQVKNKASETRVTKRAEADQKFNQEVNEYINSLVANEISKRNIDAEADSRAKDKNISVEDARKSIEQEIRRDVEQQYKEEIRQFTGEANKRRELSYAAAKNEEQKYRSDARQRVGQNAIDKEVAKIAKDKQSEIKRKQEAEIARFESSEEFQTMQDTALNNIRQKQKELWDALDEKMRQLVKEYIDAIKPDKGKVGMTDPKFRSVFSNFISSSEYSLSGANEVDLKQFILDNLARMKAIAKGESDAGGTDKQEYIKNLSNLISSLEQSLADAMSYGGFEYSDLANKDLVEEIINKTANVESNKTKRSNKERDLTNAIEELKQAKKQNLDTKPFKDNVKSIKAEIAALDELIDKEESEVENAKQLIELRAEEKAASTPALSDKLVKAEERLRKSKENLATVKREIAELEKVVRETESKYGKDSPEAERARLNLLYKQRAQATLEKNIGWDEKRVSRWSYKVGTTEAGAPTGSGTTTSSQGGIFSGVISEMKAIASSMSSTIDVDDSDIATETTLRAIFELLSGGGQASADLDTQKALLKEERDARRKEEQARVIAESKKKQTESETSKEDGKQPSKTAQAKAKLSVEGQAKFNAIQTEGRKVYSELANSDEKTIISKINEKAQQLKGLTKDTEEYLKAQYELSNMVFAYTAKLKANGVTSKTNKNGQKYLDYKDVLDRPEIKKIGDIKSLMLPSKNDIADGLVKLGFGAKLSSNKQNSASLDYQKAVEIVRGAIGDFSLRTSNANKAEKFNSLGQEVKDAVNVLRTTKEGVTKEGNDLLNKMYKLRDAASKVTQEEIGTTATEDTKPTQDTEEISNEDAEMLMKAFQEGMGGVLSQVQDMADRIATLESEKAALENEIQTNTSNNIDSTPEQSGTSAPQGGILGAINNLAKESTLGKVLTALGEIAKKNAMANSGKANSAQDLLEQFRRMLESDAWESKERVAYLDLETGAISNSITGDDKEITTDRLGILRAAYKDIMDLNAQVHTHANEEDPYFSKNDLNLFASDFADGITKQILLSKNNMTVLDMTGVQDVNGLLNALANTEQNFEALATTADKFGAKYVIKAFSDITPQGLIKMLGIKGIESKYTEAETRESARAGVAEEDAKEAAKMIQESTGRAIKTTVQRVGVELETLTEKTDAKGNKTWSSEISNKYQKAMEVTNKRIADQSLGDVFGKGTDAANALSEYETHYSKLLDLITRFKSASKEEREGLQAKINDLLPTFDQAEKKLVSLIERKDRFIGDDKVVTTFNDKQLKSTRKSLETEARKRYGGKLNPGSNVAFGGYKRGQGSGQLYVDVLKDGTIRQYVLEVDRATGQVKEYVAAENALANAFQNVNKAMKQNKFVLADVAIGDGPKKQAEWMTNASSPQLDAYKKAFEEMQNYTAQLWNSSKSPTQQQLDYLMQLSEKVIVLGKNLQKTSGEFKNFWAQNPDSVVGIDFHADDTVRSAMERYAQTNASASSSKYDFVSFDNDTLRYKLTDIEGNVRNVTLVWDELYKKVAMVSDKSESALDPLVAKVEALKNKFEDAQKAGYLSDKDGGLEAFITQIKEIDNAIQNGGTFEDIEAMRKKAIALGDVVNKTISRNKRIPGLNEIGAIKSQRINMESKFGEDFFNRDDIDAIKEYDNAYKQLIDDFERYKKEDTLYNTENQESLRVQAAKLKENGKTLSKSLLEAQKLQELAENSGTYQGKQMGGIWNLTTEEANNLEASMKSYLKTLGLSGIQNIKFNNTNNTLTASLRTSNKTVSDLEMKYNDVTGALYAYQKQERESLTGWPAFVKGFKGKIASILQYTASITSIYRVISTLRQGVQYVKEIDSALTELKKVTDETEETYDKFLNTAAKTADKVGSTIKEVVSSTADFARLGSILAKTNIRPIIQ